MYSLLLMGRLVIPPLVQLLRNLRYFKRKMASKMEKWGKVGMCIHSLVLIPVFSTCIYYVYQIQCILLVL